MTGDLPWPDVAGMSVQGPYVWGLGSGYQMGSLVLFHVLSARTRLLKDPSLICRHGAWAGMAGAGGLA